MLRYCAIALLLCLLGTVVSSAQGLRPQKISNTAGNFLAPGTLADDDMFGSAVVNLGDLDGALDPETVTALAVGISADDDGGTNRGAVWILFLTSNGTVKKQQKISAIVGNFNGELDDGDRFGSALANLGDLDGDGVEDLAVGAFGDDHERGAVWILFLDSLGTVQRHQKISDGNGGLAAGSLSDSVLFGKALVTLGDVDMDPETVTTLVVGAPGEDGGGAVWTLALDTLGTVRSSLKISANEGNFTGELSQDDAFGHAVTTLGDLDGDGISDLAVGAFGDDDGCPDTNQDALPDNCNRGAVWVLFLRIDGQVRRQVKISDTTGNFSGTIENGDVFGFAMAGLGDLNGDGFEDLAVGAYLDDDSGLERGAVWILFLDANGLVQAEQKISDSVSSFRGTLADGDFFGIALANLGDLDGDGVVDLAVGAAGDDDGGGNRGAVWTLFLETDGQVQDEQKISDTVGDFFVDATLADDHAFGSAVAPLSDLDGDEVADFAVGAPGSDEGRGTVWIFFLQADGTVRDFPKTRLEDDIDDLDRQDRFGSALATLGDVDTDPETVTTLVVGAPGDDDGGTAGSDRGAVWILFLKNDGTLQRQQKISDGNGGLAPGSLNNLDNFGRSVAFLGDLDGDGAPEVAVGAPGDDAGGSNRGTVWILFLRNDGTVRRTQKISALTGDFTGELDDGDLFGSALANLGDLDGDGVVDLAVGAPGDDDPVEGSSRGAVWILFMRDNGTVKEHQKISDGNGGLPAESLRDNDLFGSALASLGDIDDDTETVAALAVGAPGDDDGGIDQGAVRILFLQADGTIKQRRKISATAGNFTGALDGEDAFGSAVARLDDINGDGVPELVVGAPGDDDGGQDRGAVWEVFELLNAPPRVVGPSIRPQLPTPNQPVVISAVIQDESGIGSVVIMFREAGKADFESKGMIEASQANWESSLDVDSLGLEFFIEATDLEGALTRVPPPFGVISIPIRFERGLTKAEPQPNGTEETAYRLISMPLDVDLKSPDRVLDEALGPRDVNGVTQWRLFEWNADQKKFDEFLGGGEAIEMAPGKGFFLIVRELRSPLNTGSGTTVRTDSDFALSLPPGWSLIGNPFNFPIPRSNLRLESTELSPELRFYDGAWNDPAAEVPELEPFEGYAVFNALPRGDTLFIDPNLSPPPGGSARKAAARSDDGFDWSIRILAQSRQARDIDNVAAVAASASETWDPLDAAEPPPVGAYVSVYFPHPEWHNNTARYSIDTRPLPGDGVVWPVAVTTALRDHVRLRFTGLDDVPPAFEVWLVDDFLQITQDLRKTNRYTVAGAGDGVPRLLRLVVGTQAFVEHELQESREIPTRFDLFPNFPNPFNPTTTLRYGLPVAERVSLVIYNVLGEKVATLEAEAQKEAGYHAVVWDGRSDAGTLVASGVYFVRMRAGAFVQTRQMVLVK